MGDVRGIETAQSIVLSPDEWQAMTMIGSHIGADPRKALESILWVILAGLKVQRAVEESKGNPAEVLEKVAAFIQTGHGLGYAGDPDKLAEFARRASIKPAPPPGAPSPLHPLTMLVRSTREREPTPRGVPQTELAEFIEELYRVDQAMEQGEKAVLEGQRAVPVVPLSADRDVPELPPALLDTRPSRNDFTSRECASVLGSVIACIASMGGVPSTRQVVECVCGRRNTVPEGYGHYVSIVSALFEGLRGLSEPGAPRVALEWWCSDKPWEALGG